MDEKPKKIKRRKKPEYSGELGKRMSPGRYSADMQISDLLLPDVFQSIEHINFLELELTADKEKLFLLMDHFGIDRDDENEDRWRLLAFALARNHVPAFQNTTKMGAPKTKNYDPLRLYFDVRELAKVWGGKLSINAAIRVVQKRKYPDEACKTVAGWYYASVDFGDACVRDWKEEGEREELLKKAELMDK